MLEDVNSCLVETHVGSLSDVSAASLEGGFGLVLVKLVLGSARKSDIVRGNKGPWAGTLVESEGTVGIAERLELATVVLDLGDLLNLLGGEAGSLLGDQRTLGVGKREKPHHQAQES